MICTAYIEKAKEMKHGKTKMICDRRRVRL
eukprot:COSAG06_NODE_14011_length_1197_cov_264.514660_1_plen_29_part_10